MQCCVVVGKLSKSFDIVFSLGLSKTTGAYSHCSFVVRRPFPLALRDLDLSHNQLQHVPETLGRLSSLWELRLNSNRLRALPETFGHLLALERLGDMSWGLRGARSMDLSSNQLELLPEALGALRSLRELDLCKNRLRRVPESLGELEDLKCLGLGHHFSRCLESLAHENRMETVSRWLFEAL